jgi:hypothetical protein
MPKLSTATFSLFFTLAGAALVAAPGVASAQDFDSDEPAVQGTSHALPDGVPSVSPDSLDTGSQNPDALEETSQGADANLEGSQREIRAHAVNPDSITTTSEDISDLPAASVVDQPVMPASIPPTPALPESCSQPVGDRGWSACLRAVQAQLTDAQQRLSDADGALSRSITGNVQLGGARAAIIQQRNAARADVSALSSSLASQLDQARQAGVSSTVTEPFEPRTQSW